MRITFVMPFAGMAGGNRVIAIYAGHLARRGHSVEVVSQPAPRPSYYERLKGLVSGVSAEEPVTAPYFKDLGAPLRVLETPRPVTDADMPDADIVIATWWETAEWVARLSLSKGMKAHFVQGHEVFPHLPVDRCEQSYRLPLRKIVISSWLKEVMETKYNQRNISLIPNSVDQTQFFCESRMMQKFPTVGFLYSTMPLKGIDVTVRALELARKQLISLRAIAFGAEPISPKLPLPEWVEYHHLPPQQQIRAIYSRCDVWLCGSRSEGFGLTSLEAMACRCPVVSTRVGGALDTIVQGVNGYVVEIDDDLGLSERLLKVLMQSNLEWQKMSAAAVETATRYTWEDAVTRFERALNDIAQGEEQVRDRELISGS